MDFKAALAIVFVFIGCCSNGVFMEMVVKEDPGAGNLVTFLQFLFIAVVGFITVGKFGTAQRHIPFNKYLVLVGFLWTSSVANNYAFDFNISMPLHMIFRAGSLVANMALGVWILKKRYSPLKYIAVVMISAGIVAFIVQSGGEKKAPRLSHPDAAMEKFQTVDWLWWCLGIAILTFALFLSARMGIFQETLYAEFGKRPWESLYYTHLLPLPIWLPMAPNLFGHLKLAADSTPIELLGVTIPQQVLWMVLYVVTSGVCSSSVYILTTECSSLTVNMINTIRKFFSLLFSILYFRNPFTIGHWIGTLLVFIGTLIFTELLQNCVALLVPAKVDKVKEEVTKL